MNVAQLLWDTAGTMPDRLAIREGERTIGFAALRDRAAAVRDHLESRALAPGSRVGILLPHGIDAAAAFYGIVAAGYIAIIINYLSRPRQVEGILARSGAAYLITNDEWPAQQVRALDPAPRIIRLEELEAVGAGGPVPTADDAPAQISFTSGSTGGPKGVVMSHANLIAGIRTVVSYLGIGPDDRIAGILPFSFVYGFNQLNCAVATGATLEVIPSTLPSEIVRQLAELRCTVLAAVPPLLNQCLRLTEFARPLPDLRIITCAGGRLSPEAVRAVRAAQPRARLFLMYGLTEVFRSTFLPPEEVDAYPGSMGRAVAGSAVYVLREDGSSCAVGEVGELVHAGPTVALGYWDDPEATARTFRPNPTPDVADPALARAVRSGDLVRRDAEGRLYYVGRRDHMIKTLGHRVSPDEVADVLFASGVVTDVAITSEPDEVRGERIVAHVILAPGGHLGSLKRWSGLELPRHMQPSRWEVRESIPRISSGKHDLRALSPGPDTGRDDASADPDPPRMPPA